MLPQKLKFMDNKKSSQKVSIVLASSWLTALTIFVVPFFIDFKNDGLLQVIAGVLIVLIFVMFLIGGFFYVDIDVENNSTLSIKHYNLFPLWRKFKMIKIPLKRLYRIEVKSYFLEIFTFVYIYEEAKKGIARYPGIGFSAFPNLEKKAAITLLKKLVGIKQ